jgi:hypothetical protein
MIDPLKEFVPSSLCLECGLCCNGVLFGDVKLQPGDDPTRLRALGLPVRNRAFRQPCMQWQDCRCAIYSERPAHCRKFECLLLKQVTAKRLSPGQAREIIRRAQKKLAGIGELLSALGEAEQSYDLRARYRRITRVAEVRKLSSEHAAVYSRLTIEFHQLDRLLRERFYDETDSPPA